MRAKNPGGVAAYSYVIREEDGNLDGKKPLNHQSSKVIGMGTGMSNNLAEYAGLVEAMKLLFNHEKTKEPIQVNSDSMLLVKQMEGLWACHGGHYKELYIEAMGLKTKFSMIRFQWIPREMNTQADGLCKVAYENFCREKGLVIKYIKR